MTLMIEQEHRRFLLLALFCTTLSAPLWIPLVMGAVPSKPVLDASPARDYILNSPWDRVRYGEDSGDESSFHKSFPVAVDPLAFQTTGGEPNDRVLLRPAFAALGRVTVESDRALSTGDRAAARRVLRSLDHWSAADAFAGSPRTQLDIIEYDKNPAICEITGEPWNIAPPDPVREWSDTYVQLGPNGYGEPFFLSKLATGSAVSFLQIRNAVSPDSDEVQRVKTWFRGDLMKFQKEFAILCFQVRRVTDHVGQPLPDREMMLWGWEGAHNKVFCSLLAVTALAIAADDEASFQWAIEAFDFALNQIEQDGTHRATLYEKGGKSLLYHNFIADTVVPLAVLADANGHAFLSDPRLTRLIRRVTAGHTDPAYFEQLTGMPQEHGRFTLGGTSGWSVIYNAYVYAYVGDRRVASIASPRRVVYPLFAGSGRRIGGHPKYWYPERVDPQADWMGIAHFYAWVVGLLMIGSALSVACWARGRKITAAVALLPPLWPIALLICIKEPRVNSMCRAAGASKRDLFVGVATWTLLLATLGSTGIGFFWSYLLLRII
jgi:hypothetical protein